MCGLLLDESSPSFLNSIPISFRDVVSVLPFIFFSLFLLYYSYSLKQRISHTFLCSKAKKWKRIIVLTDRPRLSLSLYLSTLDEYLFFLVSIFWWVLSMVDSIIYVICKSVTIWYESTTLYLLLMPYVVVVVVCEKKSKWKHVVSLVNAPRRRRRHVWKKNSKWKDLYIYCTILSPTTLNSYNLQMKTIRNGWNL